jgi:hypothetical protein
MRPLYCGLTRHARTPHLEIRSCFTEGFCLAVGATPYPIGCVSPSAYSFVGKGGHCCAIGLPCCFIGLKTPETIINHAGHLCCLKSRAQFPCGSTAVPGCLLAVCFLSCLPECKFCRTPDHSTCKFKVDLAVPLSLLTHSPSHPLSRIP